MSTIWEAYPWRFGVGFCIVKSFVSELTSYASVLTIAAFTTDRYVAICHPLKSHTISSLSRAVKIVVLAWVLAAFCALPYPVHTRLFYGLRDPCTGEGNSGIWGTAERGNIGTGKYRNDSAVPQRLGKIGTGKHRQGGAAVRSRSSPVPLFPSLGNSGTGEQRNGDRQAVAEQQLAAAWRGQAPPKRRRKWRVLEANLIRL
ncbi:hypothetical protein ACOMHN_051396 [Nucella lapillus]